MVRAENWPLLLSSFLRERRTLPFSWGSNDCLIFAADAVRELTGFDPAAAWRGTYSNEEGAHALLDAHGGVEGIITEGLMFPPGLNYSRARRGDVVAITVGGVIFGGIVDDTGSRVALPMSDKNTIVRFPINTIVKVWSY